MTEIKHPFRKNCIEKEYTKQVLSNGDVIIIVEGKAYHYFETVATINGDQSRFVFELIHVLCFINGERISIQYIENLPMKDVLVLQEITNLQLTENYKL